MSVEGPGQANIAHWVVSGLFQVNVGTPNHRSSSERSSGHASVYKCGAALACTPMEGSLEGSVRLVTLTLAAVVVRSIGSSTVCCRQQDHCTARSRSEICMTSVIQESAHPSRRSPLTEYKKPIQPICQTTSILLHRSGTSHSYPGPLTQNINVTLTSRLNPRTRCLIVN